MLILIFIVMYRNSLYILKKLKLYKYPYEIRMKYLYEILMKYVALKHRYLYR